MKICNTKKLILINSIFFFTFISADQFNNELSELINKEINILKDYRKNASSLLTSEAPTRIIDGLKVVHNISDGVIRIWNIDTLLPNLKQKINNSNIFKN